MFIDPAHNTPPAPARHRPDNESAEGEQLLRMADIRRITGLSRSTIYRYIKRGLFPKPYRLGPGRVGWKKSEILEWQAQLRRSGPGNP
jgi:prophage regulatory protein